jgi:NitT/TauT family transport system permease protein
MLCGRYKYFEQILRPYINAMLTTPSVIFAPVYFAIFGLARWSIVGLIVHYSVFYIIVNTTTAVQSVDRGMIEMSMVFGASERQQMRLIYLPSSLPLIFASLRVALARSVKGMINGELLIAVIGLGAFSSKFASVYDAEGVFAVALLVVLVAIILSGCLNMVNKRVNSWVPNIRKDD